MQDETARSQSTDHILALARRCAVLPYDQQLRLLRRMEAERPDLKPGIEEVRVEIMRRVRANAN